MKKKPEPLALSDIKFYGETGRTKQGRESIIMSDDASTDVTSLTVQLLSAYLSNNTVPSGDLAELIATTRSALAAKAVVDTVVEEETYEPAVSVRKSLGSRDFIISMIDGKPYKMLKRHLSLHGLTPAEYRARYNLPSDYPMVAAAYSERRREVAKTLGLGRKGRVAPVEAARACRGGGRCQAGPQEGGQACRGCACCGCREGSCRSSRTQG
jgi:predicted transcriptional regulator